MISYGKYENGQLEILNQVYPAKLVPKVQYLVDSGSINLTEQEQPLILVPNTKNPHDTTDYRGLKGDQESYLEWTIIGIPLNQEINQDELDIVQITCKVIKEVVRFNFLLVKLEHRRNQQILKLHGRLEDSIEIDDYGNLRGTAVDKYFDIDADVIGNELHIIGSWKCEEEPVIKVNNEVKNHVISLDAYRASKQEKQAA